MTALIFPKIDALPVKAGVIAALKENGMDALRVDPFVSSHSVSENDNMAIETVARTWAEVVEEANVPVELVHHVRKGQSGQGEHTVDDARGASALIAASRSARVLNRMSKDEASQAGVADAFAYFRVDTGKANLAPPPAASDWFRLVSIPLGNGTPGSMLDDGDRIGVVTPWTWPELMSGVTVARLRAAQPAVAAGRWRENHQAKDWVGVPIAKVLGLDPKSDRKRVLAILKVWMKNEMFVVVEGLDERRERPRSLAPSGRAVRA